jgi:hypothetical protein
MRCYISRAELSRVDLDEALFKYCLSAVHDRDDPISCYSLRIFSFSCYLLWVILVDCPLLDQQLNTQEKRRLLSHTKDNFSPNSSSPLLSKGTPISYNVGQRNTANSSPCGFVTHGLCNNLLSSIMEYAVIGWTRSWSIAIRATDISYTRVYFRWFSIPS